MGMGGRGRGYKTGGGGVEVCAERGTPAVFLR